MNNKILVICGPTATGKTKLGIQLAQLFNGEIVSSDSRQVYKGMDVGTGKDIGMSNVKCQMSNVSIKIKKNKYNLLKYIVRGIPIWMYDVVLPDEDFSIQHYQQLAHAAIQDIWKRNKLPIVVGGTGFYIQSLVKPIDTIQIPPNEKLRTELQSLTIELLQKRLQEKDFSSWEHMNHSDRGNPRRLIRKIEIAEWRKKHSDTKVVETPFVDRLFIGLHVPMGILKKRIHKRVDARVAEGVVNEIQTLVKKGFGWHLRSFSSLGYKEWKTYRKWYSNPDAVSEAEIINNWKTHEVQYAKKQMTWFNKDAHIHWINPTNKKELNVLETLVRSWYTKK